MLAAIANIQFNLLAIDNMPFTKNSVDNRHVCYMTRDGPNANKRTRLNVHETPKRQETKYSVNITEVLLDTHFLLPTTFRSTALKGRLLGKVKQKTVNVGCAGQGRGKEPANQRNTNAAVQAARCTGGAARARRAKSRTNSAA